MGPSKDVLCTSSALMAAGTKRLAVSDFILSVGEVGYRGYLVTGKSQYKWHCCKFTVLQITGVVWFLYLGSYIPPARLFSVEAFSVSINRF